MTTKLLSLTPALLLCLALGACKKPAFPGDQATVAGQAGATASAQPTPQTPVAAERAATSAAPAAAPFDFSTVPEVQGAIPPFPYVAYPPKVDESSQRTVTVPMDEVDVILGTQLHRLEGRVAMRTFAHRNAGMSALEVRRNYENALRAFGAVKVNADKPGAHYASGPGMEKLRVPDDDMSYNVYLARKGPARHWIVVMTSDDRTRLLAIEEQPFAPTMHYEGAPGTTRAVTAAGAPPAAAVPFNIDAIPVHTAPLPPFPFLAYPDQVSEGYRKTRQAGFDTASFIVGKQVRSVEGKVETRRFENKFAGMSRMAIQRNYEAALAGLGAVRVDTVAPEDKALIAANGNADDMRTRLGIEGTDVPYASYLVRTPDKQIWVALMLTDDRTSMVVAEEKAMQQTVALVTADTMRSELAAKGRIALYINFDTDRATIRGDGKPVVDEIAKLLKNDPTLKLSIEGHTDNSGDDRHNLTLSRQRADAVVQALAGSGIDSKRLHAAGRGATTPLADNMDEAGRAKNRRVELVKI